ncbi:mannitol-1-phosphate 5-dehydrogenase [Gracilibacillus kekensis]|uniref:Mannitol-1-phosphate 5-dehydrogenase n=1 Tax=Gracilibacillus kekensis TaxID=1027249 RepID=A0A1M7L8G0_9BACI|nr:mannitol-1-phosphate 5-dehydrogenase [Gracilibacillus kekensis]SHM74079.1 D-mannitol 1-phosphate 5-dehydrogenase [Gracilibacillus kekensis]
MKAVHFGAGNIGRGFIGLLLHDAGYHTTFVDVNKEIIDAINQHKQYRVLLADQDQQEQIVTNISGINSSDQLEDVSDAIATADIITTAVGPNVLPIIAGNIANGLLQRFRQSDDPVNIIACENMIGGSRLLKEKVLEHIPAEQKSTVLSLAGFPDAAVDRIVPNQSNEKMLTVSVEPYYEWVVEMPSMKGEVPNIKGITYVEELTPYIERKLFTVNTGHAAAAYLGQKYYHQTIEEAIQDQNLRQVVEGALKETGDVLIEKYQFDRDTHEQYREKIIGRFTNPYLSDQVIRVGRGPLRKLSANDRLIRPATLYMELFNRAPENLTKVIAAAMQYQDNGDPEAVELQQKIKANGYSETLEEISGLPKVHLLHQRIIENIQR